MANTPKKAEGDHHVDHGMPTWQKVGIGAIILILASPLLAASINSVRTGSSFTSALSGDSSSSQSADTGFQQARHNGGGQNQTGRSSLRDRQLACMQRLKNAGRAQSCFRNRNDEVECRTNQDLADARQCTNG